MGKLSLIEGTLKAKQSLGWIRTYSSPRQCSQPQREKVSLMRGDRAGNNQFLTVPPGKPYPFLGGSTDEEKPLVFPCELMRGREVRLGEQEAGGRRSLTLGLPGSRTF